jgi:hypothetical protein
LAVDQTVLISTTRLRTCRASLHHLSLFSRSRRQVSPDESNDGGSCIDNILHICHRESSLLELMVHPSSNSLETRAPIPLSPERSPHDRGIDVANQTGDGNLCSCYQIMFHSDFDPFMIQDFHIRRATPSVLAKICQLSRSGTGSTAVRVPSLKAWPRFFF